MCIQGLLEGVEDVFKLQAAADFYQISQGEDGQAFALACDHKLTELVKVGCPWIPRQ